jgi:hypothetical protein
LTYFKKYVIIYIEKMRKEVITMDKKGIYMCPTFDETCPYCKKGMCYMQVETGDSPLEECEAWADEEEEE